MGSSLEIMREFTGGQIAAILNKVSSGDPEKLEALLRDEFDVRLVERILKLVDKNGRIIPRNLKSAVCDINKDFYLIQPQFATIADYADRLVRFQEAFKQGSIMSAAEFEGRSRELVAEIKSNKDLCNLLNGVYLPIILSKLESFIDYGKILEDIFLPAVKISYEKRFPNRKFYNYRKDNLAGRVAIVPGARHERLVERIKQSFVVAVYFPTPLQGFSVLASREQMVTLPESLILSGGFDTLSATAMYPDVLARDWHTPGYDLSALSWQGPGSSLCLGADGGRLGFGSWGSLGVAHVYYSSGLLFLGSV